MDKTNNNKEKEEEEARATTMVEDEKRKVKENEENEEEEEEPIMSMNEVLQNFKDLEKEAEEKEKEHWGEESVCTYDKGYINQPVYACLTCSKACGKPVGVCYGCYLNCHLNHDTVELFYKHRFKCDCGTPRIPDFDCTLIKRDDPLHFYENDENEYNHNFEGRFCWCDKFYDAGAETDSIGRVCGKGPGGKEKKEKNEDDDDDDDESQMIQCIACEDWFHGKCIKSRNGAESVTPDESEYDDFICDKCYEMYKDIFDRYALITFDSRDPLVAPESCPFAKEDKVETKRGKCLFLREDWSKALCRCAECSARYASSKNPWIFELPKDDDDKNGEANHSLPPPPPPPQADTQDVQDAQEPDIITRRNLITPTKLEMQGILAMGKSLTQGQQCTMYYGLTHFNESLKRFLAEKEGNVVTKQDIQDFMEEFKEKEAKRRRFN